MSPDFVGGIFILERCGACSGKSAEIKMGVRGANGHPFDLASPTVDHRVTQSVPVIPPSPQKNQSPRNCGAFFMPVSKGAKGTDEEKRGTMLYSITISGGTGNGGTSAKLVSHTFI